jgi:hypothetical protein
MQYITDRKESFDDAFRAKKKQLQTDPCPTMAISIC